MSAFAAPPGAEIVEPGLADLAAGRDTVAADAVAMASTRLREAGIDVPARRRDDPQPPAHRLYAKLAREDARAAHSRYNAIVRRVISFARAAEHENAADAERVRRLAAALGRVAPSGTCIYLTGGATAVLNGWRATTTVVDLRIEPESDEMLRAIAELKEEPDLNIGLASPVDFLPELPGWRERSPFRFREGSIEVFDFDLYSQALSKIERGLDLDLADVRSMLDDGLVERDRLRELFASIVDQLYRFPAVDPGGLAARLDRALAHT